MPAKLLNGIATFLRQPAIVGVNVDTQPAYSLKCRRNVQPPKLGEDFMMERAHIYNCDRPPIDSQCSLDILENGSQRLFAERIKHGEYGASAHIHVNGIRVYD